MRCFVPPDSWQPHELTLPPEEVHHLRTVMRARAGTPVLAFDGRGRSAECEIVELDRRHARLRVIQQHDQPRPKPEFILLQGLPREQKMDFLIQKATELGVHRIRPVQTDHAVVRLRVEHEEAKRERWQRIALNAAKQCGTTWIPEIAPVQPLLECLTGMPRVDLLLVCSLEPDAIPLRAALQPARDGAPACVAVLVGPEGDFSARERAAARNAGGRPIRLGDSILRSETAALFVLSVLAYELASGGPGG